MEILKEEKYHKKVWISKKIYNCKIVLSKYNNNYPPPKKNS